MRRMLIVAAVLASSVGLLAQERATFIMNNGERISGVIDARNVTRAPAEFASTR